MEGVKKYDEVCNLNIKKYICLRYGKSHDDNLLILIGTMVKLRNFWVVLAMGCAFSMGTSSCSEDDDDDSTKKEQKDKDDDNEAPKEEQKDKDDDENKEETVSTPEELGESMKEIISKIDTEDGSSLLAQATQMTQSQLESLAETLVEYNKNKDNSEWMKSFLEKTGSDKNQDKTVSLLDETIIKLEKEGVVMSELDKEILLEFAKEYFKGTDGYGTGKADGIKEGATHEKLFNEIYESKLKDVDVSSPDMMNVVDGLTDSQTKELVSVILAWDSKKTDKDWRAGFIEGVNMKNPSDGAELETKLDQIVSNDFMMAMLRGML